jgi:hypothetical protein
MSGRAIRQPALLLACSLLPLAHADDGPGRGPRIPLLPAYQAECGACHAAYPPGLLPAASWQRLMAHLPQHFGIDASLDPAMTQQLSTWLEAHAAQAGEARRPASGPSEDRITRSRWFARKHDEVPPSTWGRPTVRSPANCAACHPKAEQGVFDEHDVRIPR